MNTREVEETNKVFELCADENPYGPGSQSWYCWNAGFLLGWAEVDIAQLEDLSGPLISGINHGRRSVAKIKQPTAL